METQHLSSLQTVHQVPCGVLSPFHILSCQLTERTGLGEYLGSKPCLTCMVIVSFPRAVCMMSTVHYQLFTETENGAAP